MEDKFYAYMSRLKNIKRWGLMRNTEPENVAEHTFQVVMISHALCLIHNLHSEDEISEKDVVLSALYHETAEAITGDLPTPIKYYNEDISSAYKAIEHQAEETMMHMLPPDLRASIAPYVSGGVDEKVRRIVKAADTISAYIKCIEEKKSGNGEFDLAARKTLEKLRCMQLPEVEYFMDHFLAAYEKTLDELNA